MPPAPASSRRKPESRGGTNDTQDTSTNQTLVCRRAGMSDWEKTAVTFVGLGRPGEARMNPRHPPRHSRESGNPEGRGEARPPPGWYVNGMSRTPIPDEWFPPPNSSFRRSKACLMPRGRNPGEAREAPITLEHFRKLAPPFSYLGMPAATGVGFDTQLGVSSPRRIEQPWKDPASLHPRGAHVGVDTVNRQKENALT